MVTVPLPRLLTVEDWMLTADPPGGRYEILDGALVMSPSASSVHNRLAEDLADLLRAALRAAGIDLTVTFDVEWRVVIGDRVREAPRPDVAIGWVDPDTRRLGGPMPTLVVEVWNDATERYVVRAKRRYWASKGARWLWEITVGIEPDETVLEVFDLHADAHRPMVDVRGGTTVELTDPVPVTIEPASILGWTDRETLRAESEHRRAESEAAAAAEARGRAEAAERRAEVLEEQLRRMGVEPEDTTD